MHIPSVQRVLCPHAHFRVYYILPTWVFDSVLFIAIGCGDRGKRTGRWQAPTSFVCSIISEKCFRLGCLRIQWCI